MAVPVLNKDVLIVVCDFLFDVSDVLAVSLTCSFFRPIAVRRLLAVRPVLFKGGASIRRFHAFLVADAPARAPLIRGLEIQCASGEHPLQPGDVALLTQLLIACHRLERVTFGHQPEFASLPLTGDLGIIDAIASIPSLRSLSVSGSTKDALVLVRNLRAPLRHLGLWCVYMNDPDQFHWYPAAFQDALVHLAPSLEELGLRKLVVDPERIRELRDSEEPVPPSSSWTQYPAVRSLSVNYFAGRLLLEPLLRLFPSLEDRFSVGMIDMGYPEDTLAVTRASNWRAQGNRGEYTSGDGSPSYAWRKLDSVVCSSVAFYLFGLRCPIRFVTINSIGEYYSSEVVHRCIAESLHDNPVPHLTLCLPLDDGLAMLGGLPPPEMGGTLTHLTLVLDAATHVPQAPFGWNELLDEIRSSLRSLDKLTHLRIVIHSKSPIEASASPSLSEQLIHPSTFDFQGTASSLVRPLPSLRALFLTTCGYFTRNSNARNVTITVSTNKGWCVSRAWSVAASNVSAGGGQDGEPMLVELGDEVAEAIIQREELTLPDSYKGWFSRTMD